MPDIKQTPQQILDAIRGVYSKFRYETSWPNTLRLASKQLSGLHPTEPIIQGFINEDLGKSGPKDHKGHVTDALFLTALIQESSTENLTLDMRKLPPLDGLCAYMSKWRKVTFIGDVGDNLASGAITGSITVKGNAGNYVGCLMENALVNVEGNAQDHIGAHARSGRITVGGKIKGLGSGLKRPQYPHVRIFEGDKQVWPTEEIPGGLKQVTVDEETLAKCGAAYSLFHPLFTFDSHKGVEYNFNTALGLLAGLEPSQQMMQAVIDQKFPVYLGVIGRTEMAGILLSAMIHKSPETKISLRLDGLQGPLDFVCCLLEKPKEVSIEGDVGKGLGWGLRGATVVVNGSAGDETARKAESGTIHVKGNAGEWTGAWLKGATVVVDENAGNWTGYQAESGTINVKGNAGNRTGEQAESGTIHVKGNAGDGTGVGLKGASLTVDGSVGNGTGLGASSGTIHVKGNAGKGTGAGLMGAEVVIEKDAGGSTGRSAGSGRIHVNGNAGDLTGCELRGASLMVDGDAGNQTALSAYSGTIHIDGNTGDNAGENLQGAKLLVGGNAGENTGLHAKSGEIEVEGTMKSLGKRIKRNVVITEAGKQVWPKKRWFTGRI